MPVSAAPTVGNHGAGIRSAAETFASGSPTQRAVLKSGPVVWGQRHVASGLASILNATTPLFTVLIAHLLTPDERLQASRWISPDAVVGGY